jgi:hypothetical protein
MFKFRFILIGNLAADTLSVAKAVPKAEMSAISAGCGSCQGYDPKKCGCGDTQIIVGLSKNNTVQRN